MVVLATRPAGRLFVRLDTTATITPDAAAAPSTEAAAPSRKPPARAAINPLRSRASTSTNSPATSGSTDHDTPRTMGRGELRLIASTVTVASTPMRQVGAPSWIFSADTASRTIAVRPMPASTVQPPAERLGWATPQAQSPASALR